MIDTTAASIIKPELAKRMDKQRGFASLFVSAARICMRRWKEKHHPRPGICKECGLWSDDLNAGCPSCRSW